MSNVLSLKRLWTTLSLSVWLGGGGLLVVCNYLLFRFASNYKNRVWKHEVMLKKSAMAEVEKFADKMNNRAVHHHSLGQNSLTGNMVTPVG